MKIAEVDRLLDPKPMALEMGYERLDDGTIHLAVRTDMHRCTGEMLTWWFRHHINTQQYIWWHPVDHVSSTRIEGTPDTHIGSIHKVEEFFTGMPMMQLLIQFRDPLEFFSREAYEQACQDKKISAAICARSGRSWEAPRDADGRMLGNRLFHIARDTDWGCVLRSHFFMGADLHLQGKSADEICKLVSVEAAEALLQHCYNEFTFLSRFLPSLYIGENRETIPVKLPF
jgi:hypothetical protein